MAGSVEGTSAQKHHLHEAPEPAASLFHFHQYHHSPPPHQHHPPPPRFFLHRFPDHHHHHPPPHHYHLPPPPFLCARCNCWNFPSNPHFNPHPLHQHYPHPHAPHSESAELLQAQENPEADYQAENIPSDRCDADVMEDVEEDDYEFVMTDEWMEFFAKSEARRQEKKRQQKKATRDFRKATRARSQAEGASQPMNEECAL